jgi:CII-binding regulator of phage lambda lysogenization HflD
MQQRNNEDNLNPRGGGITSPEDVDEDMDSPFATNSQGRRGSSSKQSGGGKPNWFILLGVLILAVVASYLLASYSYVKVTDDKKNWSGYTATINQLNADLKTLQTNLNNVTTTVNGVSGQVNSTVQASLASVYDQLSKDEAKLDSLTSQISAIQNGESSNSTNITNLQNSLNELKAQLKTDEAALTALQTTVSQLASLSSDVATLKTQMASVLTPTTTPTTTTTTGATGVSSTLNGVTATITGASNWITGTSTAAGMTLTGTSNPPYTGSFGVEINNANAKQVNNLRLGIVFYGYDKTTGTYVTLTANPTGTLVGTDPTIIWTLNTTTLPYVFGFSNNATVNLPGISGWSVPAGVINYQMTFTLTNPVTGSTYYIVPSKIIVLSATPS